ncbi:MAG: cytochrome c oxidase subunit 3 [Bacteroidales bacterium]
MIEHRDDLGSRLGMWLFVFTELLLFGMLFLVYSVFRTMHPEAFELGGEELDVFMGTLNTALLLISSMTMAMSITAIQKGNRKFSLALLGVTLLIALIFLVNKYFEWGSKIEYGLYPGSEQLADLGYGTILFFGLYYMMTGIHAIHIIIGIGLFVFVGSKLYSGAVNASDNMWLVNVGLYWHLVDLIWIFLFPLFYLIH